MTDTEAAVAAPAIPGFVGKPRTRRVECTWLDPVEGAERLWAEVRSDIPLGFIREIPFGTGTTYDAIWDKITHLVIAWNCVALDLTTGEYKPVPPPSEIGREAFAYVDPIVSEWLAFVLKTTYRNLVDDDEKKGSGGGQSSPSAPASTPSRPANASPTSRKASRSTSAST